MDKNIIKNSPFTGSEAGGRAEEHKKQELFVPLNAQALTLQHCDTTSIIEVWRNDTLRLDHTAEDKRALLKINDATLKLTNMENHRRRCLYFKTGRIDTSWWTAWARRTEDGYKEVYKTLGSRNYHEACRRISESWKSFQELMEAKKEGRLPDWLEPHPPSTKKDHMEIVVRSDEYEVDDENKILYLRFGTRDKRTILAIPYRGELRWLKNATTKGRLIISFDDLEECFYASVASKVKINAAVPRTVHYAGVDIGIRILAATAITNGQALLYKGGPLLSTYHRFEEKLSMLDKRLSTETDEDALRELKKRRKGLYRRLKRRRRQTFANVALHLARELRDCNANVVFIGLPKDIVRDKPYKEVVSLWSYNEFLKRLAYTLENFNIALYGVSEKNTSKVCPVCGEKAERVNRGTLLCPKGHLTHSDVAGAANILARGLQALGINVSMPHYFHFKTFFPGPDGIREPRHSSDLATDISDSQRRNNCQKNYFF